MSGRSVLAVLSVLTALPADAVEEPSRTPVYVQHTAEKQRGKSFIFEIKEQVRQSAAMTLAESEKQAFYHVRIVALDIAGEDAIAYSAVWTFRHHDGLPVFEDQVVGICPTDRISICARSVVASTDEMIEASKKLWTDALEGLDLSKYKNSTPAN